MKRSGTHACVPDRRRARCSVCHLPVCRVTPRNAMLGIVFGIMVPVGIYCMVKTNQVRDRSGSCSRSSLDVGEQYRQDELMGRGKREYF